MKIISDNGCYVQMNDILYLLRTANNFPMGLYYEVINEYGVRIPLNQYIEIKSEEYKEYIEGCGSLFDFRFLMSKNEEDLDEFSDEIIRNSNIACSRLVLKSLKYNKNGNIKDNILLRLSIAEEKINRKYLLSQIKEIKLLKNGLSTIKYPVDECQLTFKR